MDEPEILSKKQAAAILNVSTRFLEGLIAEGKLPVSRLGRAVRINRADVLALVPPGGGGTQKSGATNG